ncbi:MAG: complex I NDUFA9 subunit family protein [Enhydrobacter sp.]|nr:complex I NDUFA9 subunit family protein [Enhydrobacter sp.]
MSITQVTVFGGSGFVGRAIVRALARQGYLVRVASRRVGLAEPVKTSGDVGQVMLMQANLRHPDSVARAVSGSQAVVNAAGIFVQRGRQSYEAVHANGARAIAEAARAAGAQRLIHVSGIGADNRSSSNAFLRSKVSAEDAVISGFNSATILRPSVVFGPEDALFNRMAAIAAKAPFVPVVGDGSARVQPVFVGDVGKAAVAALGRPDTARSVFELGGPRVYSYRDLAALVLTEIDRRKPIVGVPVGVMKLAGFFAQQIARVGLVPPITADQVELMRHDNIVRPGAQSLATLGIHPTAAEAILPTYLDRFRIGGRYNQHAPA